MREERKSPKIRPRKGKRARYTVTALLKSTTKLRDKLNSYGKIEVTSMSPLPRNKQMIMKFQVHAKTKGQAMYPVTIVFHKVEYADDQSKEFPLSVTTGRGLPPVFAKQFSAGKTPVSVRCGCKDFYYTWYYYDYKASALAGPKFRPYKRKTKPPPKGMPYRNPEKVPGLCKHIIGVFKLLQKQKILVP